MILLPLFFVSAVLVLPAIWLCAIRPYCVKHRQGFTPGANIAVTIWVDWQQARELAHERGDSRMLFWCRVFLVLQIGLAACLLLAILGSSLWG